MAGGTDGVALADEPEVATNKRSPGIRSESARDGPYFLLRRTGVSVAGLTDLAP